jgi:hypothetical protein
VFVIVSFVTCGNLKISKTNKERKEEMKRQSDEQRMKKKADQLAAKTLKDRMNMAQGMGTEGGDQKSREEGAIQSKLTKRLFNAARKREREKAKGEENHPKKKKRGDKTSVPAVPIVHDNSVPTVDSLDSDSEEGGNEACISVIKQGVARKRCTVQDVLQLGSAASRAKGRAGITKPTDPFGCAHMGIGQYFDHGTIETASVLKHHLKPGRFLEGESCFDCHTPAEDLLKLEPKKNKSLYLQKYCYFCEVGNQCRESGDECNVFFCAPCFVKRWDAKEKWKQDMIAETDGGVSRRASSRNRKP